MRPLCSRIRQYAPRLVTGGVPRRGYSAAAFRVALRSPFDRLRPAAIPPPAALCGGKGPMYSSPSSVLLRLLYARSGRLSSVFQNKFFHVENLALWNRPGILRRLCFEIPRKRGKTLCIPDGIVAVSAPKADFALITAVRHYENIYSRRAGIIDAQIIFRFLHSRLCGNHVALKPRPAQAQPLRSFGCKLERFPFQDAGKCWPLRAGRVPGRTGLPKRNYRVIPIAASTERPRPVCPKQQSRRQHTPRKQYPPFIIRCKKHIFREGCFLFAVAL